jgi:hypothetical protein
MSLSVKWRSETPSMTVSEEKIKGVPFGCV